MEKVAVLGPKGTFSESALNKYIEQSGKNLDICYFNSIPEVFKNIGNGSNIGIVPIENTLDGYVQRSIDSLMDLNLNILQEIVIPVSFSLVSNATDINNIKRLFVQFKAHGQCLKLIESLKDVEIITTNSNMESYNKVKDGNEFDGAIIPEHMYYNCNFGIKNVTDSENNYTRFLILEPKGEVDFLDENKNIKVCLCIIPNIDRSGILYEILQEFYNNNINLCSIMSRPTKKNMGTYNFYIELSCTYYEKDIIFKTLSSLKNNYNVKVLGVYSV